MNAHILCLDDNDSRSKDRQRDLEDAGFVVLTAGDEPEAVEFLKSRRVDVVCVDSRLSSASGSHVGADIKSLRPRVPIVLICENGVIPPCFQEHVDVVIDEPDFDTKAHCLLEELQDVHFPFFVKWFEEWKRRTYESRNDDTASTSSGMSETSNVLTN